MELDRFPSHRSEWTKWKMKLCDALNKAAPRSNGDNLATWIVYAPADASATVRGLFN